MFKELLDALGMAFAMGWEILWPLVLGFALSAAIQAIVSHREMSRLLPDDSPRSIGIALALGSASSSCSYAAVAIARSIFRKGANFTAAMAFEMASTNLVLELSIILIVLMGWHFMVAEAIAGAIAAWVPQDIWKAFFLTDHPVLATLWGPLVGPLVAIIAFVCSVGNIPLAAVLWNGGISFGSVLAFILADLIVLPILNIYRKYYGLKMAAFLLVTFYVAMAVAALGVEGLFSSLGLIPHDRQARVVEASITWNYTTWLNIGFLLLAALLVLRFVTTGGIEMLRMMNKPAHGDAVHHRR